MTTSRISCLCLGAVAAVHCLHIGCGGQPGGGNSGEGPTSLETDRITVATPQAGKVEMAGSDTGYFEGRLSGQADLDGEPAADAASATASITADNVRFVSGIEKSSVAAQLTGRWADITLYVAPADAEQTCADDFVVLEITAIEDDAGIIDLWGTAEAVLAGEILQAVAADDFAVCLQVVTNFPGSVIVDAVDIAFGDTPAADNGEDDTDGMDDAGQSLTTASMRVLQVGDSWTYDEQQDGTVDGETVVSVTGTHMLTVSPDTIVDLAGNTAGIISSRLELISEDGDGRVMICHRPPGNPDNARTLTVGADASAAHLAHGDFCGSCSPSRSPG